jgi:hypothetical protein
MVFNDEISYKLFHWKFPNNSVMIKIEEGETRLLKRFAKQNIQKLIN